MTDLTAQSALWWAVVFSGLYHGVNPGMGWPLAVSAALMQGRRLSLMTALGMLAVGHLLAMLAIKQMDDNRPCDQQGSTEKQSWR